MQYESLNRCVFRRLLNAMTVSDDQMLTGRLFHASGLATANAWLPNLTRILVTRRSPRAAERSDRCVDRDAHVSDVGCCEAMCARVREADAAASERLLLRVLQMFLPCINPPPPREIMPVGRSGCRMDTVATTMCVTDVSSSTRREIYA